MIWVDDRAIKRIRIVIHTVVNIILRFSAGLTSFLRNFGAGFDNATMLCDLGFNPVNARRNINTINDRIIVGVFFNDIVIKESICFRCRGGCQAKHMSAREVIQNRTPFSINRTMAFINNDELEVIWR